MIRPTTIAWLALATVIVMGLFHVKYQVQALEDEIVRVNRQIVGEQEAIHVLQAEWSYVNQPRRLEALSSRHLDLQPLKPAQIVNMAEFGPETLDAFNPPAPPAAPPVRAIVLTPPRPREAPREASVKPVQADRPAFMPIVLIPPKPREDR
jgi:hypothetical protein